jgi:SAM-dependent methyltransferase
LRRGGTAAGSVGWGRGPIAAIAGETAAMFVGDYAQLALHRLMLSDRVRTESYGRALASAVKTGDVVLDVGAGTGIMGMLAVRAGARKVYAVEQAGIVELARRLVQRNGMEDRIEIIESAVESVELPERVDVIVGEWMGCHGVDENLLPSILLARDRWLKPGGRVVPEAVTSWLAPAEDEDLSEELGLWRSCPYDLDFSALAEASANEVRMGHHGSTADKLLAEPQQLWTVDVRSVPLEEARRPFSARLRFSASRRGRLAILVAWFVARFPDGSALTNAPDAPETHWGRSGFPLNNEIAVEPGTAVEVELTCEPAGPGYCHHQWAVRVGTKAWEHHSTRWDPTLPDD